MKTQRLQYCHNNRSMRSLTCQAILFDLDGTLVDSTQQVEDIWRRWAERNGIEPSRILSMSHGRRTEDTLREVAPHLDIEAEARFLNAEELRFHEGIKAIQGSGALLETLPSDRWAVVTSATHAAAIQRLRCAGLLEPTVLVAAEDVLEGKPDPAGYLRACELLGFSPDQCLVVEDAPAGILAARAAGMRVLGVTTTFPASELLADECIRDFRDVRVVSAMGDDDLHLQLGCGDFPSLPGCPGSDSEDAISFEPGELFLS
jgi:mannitol-1-/sugar-/sorbitol-6-phosphatase